MLTLHDPSKKVKWTWLTMDASTLLPPSTPAVLPKLWRQATNVGVQGDIVGILAQLHMNPTRFSHGNQFWFVAIRQFFFRP